MSHNDGRWRGPRALGAAGLTILAAAHTACAPRLPTNLSVSQRFAQETRLHLAQPLVAPQALAAQRVSRANRSVQDAELRRAARQLAADAQLAYLAYATAARAAEIHASTVA